VVFHKYGTRGTRGGFSETCTTARRRRVAFGQVLDHWRSITIAEIDVGGY
jgi:hypothetical protein